MADKKLYWLSWYQPTEDYRPKTFPPNEATIGWWWSGHADEGATLCALVQADSEEEAKGKVKFDWPEAVKWRFCEERSNATFVSDRFRPYGWMLPRFAALKD